MSRKKEFHALVESLGYEFSRNSEYETVKKHVYLIHKKCGYEFRVRPDRYRGGVRCPNCTPYGKIDTEIAKNRIKSLVEEEYSLVGEYTNAKTKVTIRHENKSCNYYQYDVLLYSFLNGDSFCHRCSGRERLNTEDFKKRVFGLVGNEYSVLGEYVNSDEPILMKHNNKKCGNTEWNIRPYNFTNGNRCPTCYGAVKYNTDTFSEKVMRSRGKEYSVVGEYVNAHVHIRMKHNSKKCGYHEWDITPNSLLSGRGCPKCATVSVGEKRIDRYLKGENIEYETQVMFDDCRIKRPLPFDFGIYDKGKLVCLVEFQGIQHYEPVEYFGGKQEFEIRVRNDNIKRGYCTKNNIPLLEIPYWEIEEIEKILGKKLDKLSIKGMSL